MQLIEKANAVANCTIQYLYYLEQYLEAKC